MISAIGLLLGFFLILIGHILFWALIAAAVDYKCGGSFGERFLRAVVEVAPLRKRP